MKLNKQVTVASAAAVIAFVLSASPAFAGQGRGQGRGQDNQQNTSTHASPFRPPAQAQAPARPQQPQPQQAPSQSFASRFQQRAQAAPRQDAPRETPRAVAPQRIESPRPSSPQQQDFRIPRQPVPQQLTPGRQSGPPQRYNAAPQAAPQRYDGARQSGQQRYDAAPRQAAPRYDAAPRYSSPQRYDGSRYAAPHYSARVYVPTYRPYYTFRSHFSLGIGIFLGYPVAYPPWYSYPVRSYDYGYANPGYITAGPSFNSYGAVSFDIDPIESAVFVDGTYMGVAADFCPTEQPLTLSAGRHRIELTADGFVPQVFDINVTAGLVLPLQGALSYR